ncbi:MAG TPA: rhodanese-like domain-containing protein [Candidatus Dormibacteraeota bacterium]|jgi:rhodanese-related sulfurtransferase|nr:rhodanese-like domain-containing protein [Candidatus Dormibacteraeota bacterium]
MSDEKTATFRDLKLDEIKPLVDGGEHDVVDVREPWERQQYGFIPGSRNVVLASILANPSAQKFRDGTIFVCEVGERSGVACEMAVALGVQDVINFRGGHRAWREAGLPSPKE